MASPHAAESALTGSVWTGIDHVQLAIPVGGEVEARAFYVGLLGLREVPKDDPFGNRIELIEANP